jgi:phosphate transport system protein
MRDLYRDRLSRLTVQLAQLCEQTGDAMRLATSALLDADIDLADHVIHHDARIDQLSYACEDDAQLLLAMPAPARTDPRAALAPILVAQHLARMGDLAVSVAEAVRRRYPRQVVPPVLRPRFAEMGRIAVNLTTTARVTIATETIAAARTVRDTDDEMDDLHRTLFTVVCYGEWDHGVATAVDVSLLSRTYERYADHAVSVVDQVVYAITGQRPWVDSVPSPRHLPEGA